MLNVSDHTKSEMEKQGFDGRSAVAQGIETAAALVKALRRNEMDMADTQRNISEAWYTAFGQDLSPAQVNTVAFLATGLNGYIEGFAGPLVDEYIEKLSLAGHDVETIGVGEVFQV